MVNYFIINYRLVKEFIMQLFYLKVGKLYYYCFIRKDNGYKMCIIKIFLKILQYDVLRKFQGIIFLDDQIRIDNIKGEIIFQVNNILYRLMKD